MNEEQAAKLISDTLAWAARQASCPAIHEIRHEGNEVFFTDRFSGDKFRMEVRDTD